MTAAANVLRLRLALLIILVMLAANADAAWLEVSTHHRVNPALVVAAEIRSDSAGKEATIRTQSQEHTVRTASVVAEIEALVTDAATWFPGRAETVGSMTIRRFVRKTAVLVVKYSCPSSSCTAFVDGPDNAFSRIVIADSTSIAELKSMTSQASEFTLMESPGAGFEGFVRRSAIRSVSFICSTSTMCTQADVVVPGSTRITRDAAGITALRGLVH